MTVGEAPKKSIARSLGEMFGHVVKGVKTPVPPPPSPAPPPEQAASEKKAEASSSSSRQEVQRRVEEQEVDGVVFRRTTIDEVEYGEMPKDQPDS